MASYKENVESAISTIDSIDYSKEGAYNLVVEAIKGIGKVPRFHYKIEANEVFFRSRPNDSEDYYKEVKKISYPPKDKVKNYARANKPEQSVFYCSDTRPTSYLELAYDLAENTEIGESISITISLWQIVEQIEVVLIINPNDSNQTEYSKRHKEAVDNMLNELGEDMKEGTILLYEYIAKKFSADAKHDKSIYIITSAISNFLLANDQDGVMYPSVPYQENGFNIALRKGLVDDSKVRLINVNRDTFTIEATEEGKHNFKQSADMEQGIINWSDKSISWNSK
jgi:hypothetical protein